MSNPSEDPMNDPSEIPMSRECRDENVLLAFAIVGELMAAGLIKVDIHNPHDWGEQFGEAVRVTADTLDMLSSLS